MSFKKYWIHCLLAPVLFAACSSNPSSSNGNNAIKISIRSASTSSTVQKATQPSDTTVTLTSVRLVIDEIEFESDIGDTLDFDLEEPFVRDLVVGPTVQEIKTVSVPPGTYKKLEIEIDDLHPRDGIVYTNNPDLQDLSILVKGFLNDDPTNTFQFASDLDEEQEQEFEPAITIDEDTPATNVVLSVNMNSWFVDRDGTFLDPRLIQNRSAIEGNIKNSIDVFEDKDDDGEDDDSDDD